jgi:hypothetical protein
MVARLRRSSADGDPRHEGEDMSEMLFSVGGGLLSADQLKKVTPKAPPKPKKDAAEKYHRGWRVSGHPPGALEAAQESRELSIKLWASLSEKSRQEARNGGQREPKPWDADAWRRTTKKRAVRSKPYEIHESAMQCAAMAAKAGWLDVETAAIAKGQDDGDPALVTCR